MSYQQPGRSRRRSLGQAGSSAVIVTGAVLALLVMVAVVTIGRDRGRSTAGSPAAPWPASSPPEEPPALIPLLSDPPSPSASPTAAATGNPRPVARPSTPDRSPARTPRRMLPAPGSRLTLLAAGTTDLRLRHQDFRMRLTPIGSRSPAATRADATFVLRRGLADPLCVSLESVNFPGYFMRHRNFAVLLQIRESSRLFAADATFCPRAAGPDGDFLLRAVNFPDRFVTADGPLLMLSRVSPDAAQSFRAGPGF
jgi:hypothetical protein